LHTEVLPPPEIIQIRSYTNRVIVENSTPQTINLRTEGDGTEYSYKETNEQLNEIRASSYPMEIPETNPIISTRSSQGDNLQQSKLDKNPRILFVAQKPPPKPGN